MATSLSTEVLVLGAGPGGYPAAIRLGQLGKQVLLVEKQNLGGVCLNVGCIPSKALIHVAKSAEKLRNGAELGIMASDVHVDLAKAQAWKGGVVDKLTKGVGQLCKANGVKTLTGRGEFVGPNTLHVFDESGKHSHTVSFRQAIIATGSRPVEVPVLPFDHKLILDSTDALALTAIPKSLIVVGGGYIGLELGTVYAKLGAQVTVVEMQEQLLPGFDSDIVALISRKLKKLGVEILTSTKALGVEKSAAGVTLNVGTGGKARAVQAEKLLVAVGRRPNVEGWGREKLGLAQKEGGFLAVDAQLRTSLPHILAIGDVIGQPMLAHKATHEGEIAAEVISGKKVAVDYNAVPAVAFTDPEIAVTGLSEQQAKAAGYETLVGKFPFAALGRALTTHDTDGFVKVIAEKESHVVLGVTMVGNGVSDLISEGNNAVEMAATLEDLSLSIHPHPTLSEALMEAAKHALGEAIHVVNK